MEREKQAEDRTLGLWITPTIRQGGTSKGECEWGRRAWFLQAQGGHDHCHKCC